jgi:hypothetical protein
VVAVSQHQQRIASAARRRLDVLELQATELGYDTPPQIANEIEDLRAKLAGQVEVEPISDAERYHATLRAVMLLSQQLAAVEVKTDRLMWLLPLILFVYLFASFLLEHLRWPL